VGYVGQGVLAGGGFAIVLDKTAENRAFCCAGAPSQSLGFTKLAADALGVKCVGMLVDLVRFELTTSTFVPRLRPGKLPDRAAWVAITSNRQLHGWILLPL
jgi:hypothetical protein